MPASETTMIETPITINGHCRNDMQSVLLARVVSHMPPVRMGIESRNVRKFSKPIKWLLVLMMFFFSFVVVFGDIGLMFGLRFESEVCSL